MKAWAWLWLLVAWEAAARPNVLFILSDDQRPDTIAALGNEHIQTPHLDALVRNGTTFTRAICANPICTPSRAEILTGAGGFSTGILDFGGDFPERFVLWPAAMRAGGYESWYVGKWHNKGRPVQRGYDRSLGLFASGGGKWMQPQVDWRGHPVTGYRSWIFQDDAGNKLPEFGVGLNPDISARFADAAISLIERKSEKPFFLHLNFTAPHDPLFFPTGYEAKYNPEKLALPENFKPDHPIDTGNLGGRDESLMPLPRSPELARKHLAVYYAVISHMDEQIGRVVAALKQAGEYENTLIVFSSDHGLAVGSHGLIGKQNMYEHTIGVPLIFSGPGVPKGATRTAQCYLRDLYPTVCELTGTPIPDSVESTSLVPVIRGEADTVYPEVFGYFRNFQRMIRADRWKLIDYPQAGKRQLFDLVNDPFERKNLAGRQEHALVEKDLAAKLAAWRRKVSDL